MEIMEERTEYAAKDMKYRDTEKCRNEGINCEKMIRKMKRENGLGMQMIIYKR